MARLLLPFFAAKGVGVRGVICTCHSAAVQRLSFLFEGHSVPPHANLEHLQVRSLTFPGPASYRSVFRRRDPWAQPPFSMLIAIPHRHLIRLKVGRRRETYRPTAQQVHPPTHGEMRPIARPLAGPAALR